MDNEAHESALPKITWVTPLQGLILACMYNYGMLPDRPYKKSKEVIFNAFEHLYYHYPDINAYIFAVAEMIHRPPFYIDGHGNWGRMRVDNHYKVFFAEFPAQLEYHEIRLSEEGLKYLHKKELKHLNEIMRSMRY